MPFDINEKEFLGDEVKAVSFDQSEFVIIPVPFEGAISYGSGTAGGPDAIIDASHYLELYDEVYESEAWMSGIRTIKPVLPDPGGGITGPLKRTVSEILSAGKFPVAVGGDHSISSGFCGALQEKYGNISVIQFDAHSDLRNSYEGNEFSHASVMARIREITKDTLQLGIRSMSKEEALMVEKEKPDIIFMHQLRKDISLVKKALDRLPDPVFITFDVDVFDWSVIRSTGTPEPGGLNWEETMLLLSWIFSMRKVAGFDVVELSSDVNDPNSPFAAAKLIYKMITMSLTLS